MPSRWEDRDHRITRMISSATSALGSYPAIVGAVVIVSTWAATGPLFGYSDTWQLLINTFTTLVTFWMVFIIQNTQNRDGRAAQTKLDEILATLNATDGDELIGIEDAPERRIKEEQEQVRAHGRSNGNASVDS